MTFLRYLEDHYTQACELQRGIAVDAQIVSALRDGSADASLLKTWMLEYGLFQGIATKDRNAAVAAFLKYSKSLVRTTGTLDKQAIEAHYVELLRLLHSSVQRGWVSATSKLLWCIYPRDFVIFDAFVHRALVVLQCIDKDLSSFPRIGVAPKIASDTDLPLAVSFYINYQSMVKHLLSTHQITLTRLRIETSESYDYDIRIVDKLLWMIADPKRTY